jgi:O-antigen ligase
VPVTEKVATKSADGTTSYTYVQKDRTWSDNALRYGLSTAIRLDTLWPNAIQGFLRNPLLGSGYATLNKETVDQFTEAESTDNNFLRTLGETGLLGFVSFYGIILVSIYLAYKFHQVDQTYTSAISVGFIGASLGLLLNAAYIDVFAASKVAFTYWAVTGLVLALYYLGKNQQKLKKTKAVQWYKQVKSKLGLKQ